MNKICTSKEQSEKLIELGIDVNTADMIHNVLGESYVRHDTPIDKYHTPAWSLSALFDLLPNCLEGAEPSLIKTFRNDYRIVYDVYGDEDITSEDGTNPIDVCYEMIIKLHEQKLL